MPSFADPDRYLEILQPDRCPLCFVVRAYVYEHLKSLLDECALGDRPFPRAGAFSESKGFCLPPYAWQGVHQRQALGMGVIYGSLLEKGLKELSSQPRFWKSNKPKPLPHLRIRKKLREQSCVQEFALCWSDSEKLRGAPFRSAVSFASLIWRKTLLQKMNPSQRKNLHERGKKALDRLLEDLNEFLNKQDYHRSQESRSGMGRPGSGPLE